ncbi:MAG: ACT domain-containing protein [Paraglaciecola sp.]|uniref:ACT domain-containing protein n=1 Tax=Pseudomonadati TaxID=3379134 RepID=UPI00273DD21A|nr:ACT domain-containing protein [Paraglaciecola sp.]MDP5031353.1 ACT domain-containing protein [Paraglaciecola sp.]MDP5039491.1 ACT domain-containing protein [Paraglaciecola sp.]MDP5131689.1 ACT domain-containing protein [Paraglaciecola sp.]
MSGEKELKVLLTSMAPSLGVEEFVFCTVAHAQTVSSLGVSPKGLFEESEGTTLILQRSQAEAAQLHYSGIYRCITLNVHSSLEAVGLTAAVSKALADANISANVVAAYYHDHIFVPSEQAQEAISALNDLTQARH